jgi:hypothetical protein
MEDSINCKDILGKELFMGDKVVCNLYGSKITIGHIANITSSNNIRIDHNYSYNLVPIRQSEAKIYKI